MPPMSWLLAVRGLMMRPAANTPTMRGTRTIPGPRVDPHLHELGAEGVHGVGLVTAPSMSGVYLSNCSSASGSASAEGPAASASIDAARRVSHGLEARGAGRP